jgi:hypothetical protein
MSSHLLSLNIALPALTLTINEIVGISSAVLCAEGTFDVLGPSFRWDDLGESWHDKSAKNVGRD